MDQQLRIYQKARVGPLVEWFCAYRTSEPLCVRAKMHNEDKQISVLSKGRSAILGAIRIQKGEKV